MEVVKHPQNFNLLLKNRFYFLSHTHKFFYFFSTFYLTLSKKQNFYTVTRASPPARNSHLSTLLISYLFATICEKQTFINQFRIKRVSLMYLFCPFSSVNTIFSLVKNVYLIFYVCKTNRQIHI